MSMNSALPGNECVYVIEGVPPNIAPVITLGLHVAVSKTVYAPVPESFLISSSCGCFPLQSAEFTIRAVNRSQSRSLTYTLPPCVGVKMSFACLIGKLSLKQDN